MHTADRLTSADFQYETAGSDRPAVFVDLFPDYHVLDRLAIVSPFIEDGVVGVGYGVLAVTTAFYDDFRRRTDDFFAYPQHYALVGETAAGLQSRRGALAPREEAWGSWSWLDVWPASQWLGVRPTATAMLATIVAQHINRIFWPRTLQPGDGGQRLPATARRMLRSTLKSVHLYTPADRDDEAWPPAEAIGVRPSPVVRALVAESVKRGPGRAAPRPEALPDVAWFASVGVTDFLATMGACFAAAGD